MKVYTLQQHKIHGAYSTNKEVNEMLKSVVYRVVFAVLFMLSFTSSVNAYDLLDYFPLTVGSQWVFNYGETEEIIQSHEAVAGTVKQVWYSNDMGYNIFSYDDNYLYLHELDQ